MAMLAWHFVGRTLRDGRPVPRDGETLVHQDKLVMCSRGYHASRRLLDAIVYGDSLVYGQGLTLCRVLMEGHILEEPSKVVAEKRTILWRLEPEEVSKELDRFNRFCALSCLHIWSPHPCSQLLEYLNGGDKCPTESLVEWPDIAFLNKERPDVVAATKVAMLALRMPEKRISTLLMSGGLLAVTSACSSLTARALSYRTEDSLPFEKKRREILDKHNSQLTRLMYDAAWSD